MRPSVRSWLVVSVVGALVWACGSGADSTFGGDDTNALDASTETPPPSGGFNPPPKNDAGPGTTGCTPTTCAAEGANCGSIGDGCGSVLDCGTCTAADEVCSGAGVPNKCGKPPCTPKTCADQGFECGGAGDGCGGLLACGSCEAGICGGGGPSKCGAGTGADGGGCVPTKTACGPGDCGPIGDGCGNLLNCAPTCPAGQTCGGGNTPSVCGAPPCQKKTCASVNATCGFIADGCGGVVNCWPQGAVCPPGQSCGGNNNPNVCETPAGCTGLCLQQQMCAGGGTTSIEGYVTSPNGLLPVPNAVVYVPNGAVAAFTTGVQCETCAGASGNPLISTTTDANGHFYLPNMPVSTQGQTVDIPVVVQLGRWRKQLTIQTTACTNNLVPAVGAAPANKTAALPSKKSEGDIPLTAISTGSVDGLECVFKKLGVDTTEFTDGNGDGRIRLYQDNGALITAASPGADVLYNPPAANASGNVSAASNASPIVITTSAAHGFATGAIVTIASVKGNTAANGTFTVTVVDATHFSLDGSTGNGNYKNNGTWSGCAGAGCTSEIDKYDAVIFGCVGSQKSKAADARFNVLKYANKGGRIFATHYSYVWLYSTGSFTSPWAATANKFDTGNEIAWDNGQVTSMVDTSFGKGQLFANWLNAPVAPVSQAYAPPYANVNALYATNPPTIALTEPRRDITPQAANLTTSGIVSPAQRWIYTTNDHDKACVAAADCKSGVCTASKCVGTQILGAGDPAAVDAPMHYTFNTDVTKPAAQQCGRVLYSDFHVSIGNTGGKTFPAECDANPLSSQEKVLAYMLFDLASCVSTSGSSACVPKSCPEQVIGCGLAGDGCGNQIDCGECPLGQTCGGGGVPSQCGAPACNPQVCQANECGQKGDGCGGTLDCGSCAVGQTCGGGGANLCGVGQCAPQACPAPVAGSACGPVANGCGGVNNCPCPAGMPCVNGACGAPACTPLTCQQIGANCGTVGDGCGHTLSCGNCVAPQTCGGGGIKNVCGGGVN